MTGRLFAIVGASGAGKDTLLAGLAGQPGLHRARRTISRPAAASEDFESVTPGGFAALQAAGAFAMEWQAHGLSYGIRPAELAPLRSGCDVVFNGSRAALAGIAARYPGLRVIEIAVSPAVLAARLALRGRETTEEIAARLQRADLALPAGLPVCRVLNDGPPAAGIAALMAALQPDSGQDES